MKNKKRHSRSDPHMSNFSFRIISFMHDNPLLPYFRNPQRLLKAAGLKPGQKVLEVGCGPGFFTIPAAKIVGEEGVVYAVDVHPLAIARVKEKIEKEGIKNIKPILANASDTGLPDRSVDLAFLFGLRYIAGGLENVIAEIHRILKPGGVLSFEKTKGSEKKLIEEVERGGFIYLQRRNENKNLGLSSNNFYVGGRTRSISLVADAYHTKTDIWSSVAVFVGLLGATLGLKDKDKRDDLQYKMIETMIKLEKAFRKLYKTLEICCLIRKM